MSNPIFFIELYEYTKFQLQSKLQYNDEDYFVFEKNLLEKSIIKIDSNNKIKFTFVGFIYFEEKLLMILPKYMEQPKSNKNFSKIRQIVQLLLKYSQNKADLTIEELETFGHFSDESPSNLFVLADFLMTDFTENGLYKTDIISKNINGLGEIEWNETMEQQDMFLIDNSPFYPYFFTTDLQLDEEHIIYQIHQAILNEVSAFFNKFEVFNVFNYKSLNFNVTLEEIGDFNYLISCIDKELQVEFSDRKLQLLKALKSYILNEKFESTTKGIKLFGTRTFHVIWEKVCSYVFGNQYDIFKKFIPKPFWKDLGTGITVREPTLIPDILIHDNDTKSFFILDAKYYLTHFVQNENRFDIIHNPGIGDLTKQYLYEQALRKKSQIVKESECYNIFLMPTEKDSHFFGHASIDIFNNDFKGIYLYRQNTETLYNKFLKDETIGTNYFKDFIDQHKSP